MRFYHSAAFLMGAILAANAGQAVITSTPNDLTINAGSTADFIVKVTNATSYQWMFQGTNVLTGKTNAQLNFSDVSTNQAGVYSVIVHGSLGTNITNSANLNVIQGTIVQMQISGFAGGGTSNILVELFDHDKPATVENFVNYMTSGAYRNMFFDRLITGFVLQGGDFFTADETNSTPSTNVDSIVGSIYNVYVLNGQVINGPGLPYQVGSEFYVGPQVLNTKGTLAMALPSGNVNGAANGFYFNLVDNPFLDGTNDGGPFTVFGRVLDGATNGSNILAWFNNTNEFFERSYTTIPTRKVYLTNYSTNYTTNHSGVITTHVHQTVTSTNVAINIFTNGLYNEAYLNLTSFADLPVNFHGTNVPADDNLFYVAMSFPDTNALPVIGTNPPTAAITFPSPNVILTNGISLTIRGTAQDEVGLARVVCYLVPLNGAYDYVPIGDPDGNVEATGTTDWSLYFGQVEAGAYSIHATPQNGAGYLGNVVMQNMMISAVFVNGVGSVSATNLSTGAVYSDAVGANLTNGAEYELTAQPGPGQLFANWTGGTNYISYSPHITIEMSSDLVVTANFVSNAIPGGISFTYPPLGGNTTNGNFSIQGVINGLTNTPISLTCRLFSFTNLSPVGPARQTTGTTNWSFPVTNLALGAYSVQVIAQDSMGQSTFITNNFTVGLPLTVHTNGNGRGTIQANFSGQFLVEGKQYSLRAVPLAGSVFDTWSDGVNYTNNPVIIFNMTPGLVLTAAFVANDFPGSVASPIAFTSPPPQARLTNQTVSLAGTINPSLTNPVVSYQLFYGSNSVTAPSTNVTIIPGRLKTTWSADPTNLAPGYYTAVATVADAIGRSTLISESFQVLAQVILQVNPAGSGSISSNSANWTGQFVSVGAPVTLTAKTNGGWVFAYWSNGISTASNPLTFAAATNETISANFAPNYFPGVAGAYNGLFYPTNAGSVISPSNSGGCTVTLSGNAVITVYLYFPGHTISFPAYSFPLYEPAGSVTRQFVGKGPDGQPLTNYLSLDLTNGAFTLSGTVANAKFSSSLTAYRAATRLTGNSAVMPGNYVFSLPGDHATANNLPGGDSYGAFTLGSNGAITLGGYLADNTAISPATAVATNGPNAWWPLYYSLYNGTGILLGWQTNTSPTNFEGWTVWSKPARAAGSAFYTNAFLFSTNSSSSSYIPPVPGTQYQIAFGGSSLTIGLTNILSVSAKGLFTVPTNPNNTNQLTLSLATSGANTGALNGSFTYPTSKITHTLHGAFISPSQGGFGFFTDTNSQTGWFEIIQIP